MMFENSTDNRHREWSRFWQSASGFWLRGSEVKIETRVDSWGQEDTTKTAAGMRMIPLGKPVTTMLKEWRRRTEFNKDDDLVFPNKTGDYVGHPNMVKRKFKLLFDQLDELHAKNPRSDG